MSVSEMAAKLNEAGAWVPGKRIKLEVNGEGAVMLDGVGNSVSQDNGAADTTIKANADTWRELFDGTTDGMTAFMMGKLKVDGDMSNAMQLQGVLAKLKG